MSSVTITPSEIPSFLETNEIILDNKVLYHTPNGGGFKTLSYGGKRLYIVVEGTVHRMRYEVKDKIAMEISEDTHNLLANLTVALNRLLKVSTRGVSYVGDEQYPGFWLRGQITGHEDRFFTRVYERVSSDTNEYEELDVKDCPSSFRGYVCLEVRGVFIKSLKHKDSEIYLRNEFSELVIEEKNVSLGGGSRIMKLLGGTVVTKDKRVLVKEENSEEFMW